jgi:NAD-dependent SIR2 family protein deacetylase
MDPATLTSLLASIATRRLVVFLGAGISIPAPSSLPTAQSLAGDCADKHYQLTTERLGMTESTNLEALASLFYGRGNLESYFIGRLVEWGPFLGTPNRGHLAIADFILCSACDFAVTTNVDCLVEIAASGLGENDLQSALDGGEASTPRSHRQYLKIHGCCRRKREHTLWCQAQLTTTDWAQGISTSQQWLAARLMQRDIVFLGYWTDWDYLNSVLVDCLGDQLPGSVTIVDPAVATDLEAKAPQLWQWAHRDGIMFRHEQASAVTFLEELRKEFSSVVLRRIAEVARTALRTQGIDCMELPSLDAISIDDLYDIRRDWTGVSRIQPVRRSAPSANDEGLGRFLFRLLDAGALMQGSLVKFGANRLRLLHAAGRQIHTIINQFAGEAAPSGGADITICIGADGSSLAPAHLIRGSSKSTVLRPSTTGKWYTQAEAEPLLGI